MKTSKHTFEFEIKKQIDSREIAPSRDLWASIEAQTQNQEVIQTKKINWFLVAACTLLLVSLGTALVINEDEKPTLMIAQKEDFKQNKNKNAEQKPASEIKTDKVKPTFSTANTKVVFAEKKKNIIPAPRELRTEILPSNETKMQIPVLQADKILAKTDSAKVQKRKKYVDPSTLLFSVEHKDAIEQTKDGSNVAKIDLNSK
ncbi:hypothetical protein ASG01_05905 [Chryseobacterium sp. Leaf180]|uniref:hypothetical protein n=1 Tax=Chryseobacterium sp. Leaf180 TaxID=1736289 RepID=UPI0006F43C49|nr:hypothetical protein [Chryseobacterium sp. Leaf180]KQR95380.1 hypothetical protein ASG01_05905 [Chryseobacterium sp. Leaf180]